MWYNELCWLIEACHRKQVIGGVMMRTDYTSNFIQSLQFNDANRKLAFVLLKSEEDCREFYIDFFGRNVYAIDDLLDYREHKLSISDMSLDKFMHMCNNIGIKRAFEETFLYFFSPHSIKLVELRANEGRVSLEDIYNSFVRNPNENVLKNVL